MNFITRSNLLLIIFAIIILSRTSISTKSHKGSIIIGSSHPIPIPIPIPIPVHPWPVGGGGNNQVATTTGQSYSQFLPAKVLVVPVFANGHWGDDLARAFFPPPYGQAHYYPQMYAQPHHYGDPHANHYDHWSPHR